MGQSCPAQTLVAQVSNLPYREFPIRRRRETPVSHGSPAVSRLEVGDTADWKSALQPGETDPLFPVARSSTFTHRLDFLFHRCSISVVPFKWTWSAAIFWLEPSGQRTSISSMRSAFARPIVTGNSDCDR